MPSIQTIRYIARAVSKRHHVRVSASKDWGVEKRGLDTVVLYPEEKAKMLGQDEFLGILLHNVGHVKFPTRTSIKMNQEKEVALSLLSCIRVSQAMSEKYPYAKEYLEKHDEMARMAVLKNITPNLKNEKNQRLLTLFALSSIANGATPTEEGETDFISTSLAMEIDESSPCLEAIRRKSVNRYYTEDIKPKLDDVFPEEDNKGEQQKELAQKLNKTWSSGCVTELAKEEIDNKLNKDPLFSKEADRKDTARCRVGTNYEDEKNEVHGRIRRLTKTLKRALKENKICRFGGRNRTGKLSSKKLVRARLGDTRVFERKQETRGYDLNMSLVVDVSGSMSGNRKLIHALQATALCAEVLSNIDLPVSIRLFATESVVVKSQSEKGVSAAKVDNNLFDVFGGSTNMNEPLNSVADEVQANETENTKKICLVITDGYCDHEENTVKQIQKLAKKGIHTVLFVIDSSSGENTSAAYRRLQGLPRETRIVSITKPEDVEKQLVRLLKRHIHKQAV